MNAGAAVGAYRTSGGRTENAMTLRGSMPSDSPRSRASVASMRLPPMSSTSASATSDGDGDAAQRQTRAGTRASAPLPLAERRREAAFVAAVSAGARPQSSAVRIVTPAANASSERVDARAHELTDAAVEVRRRDAARGRDDTLRRPPREREPERAA